jgi:DNA-binding XRE family transcriptional regulator
MIYRTEVIQNMQTQKFPKISLAAARVNAGLNQQEAAKALGVSVATLQNYESGKTVPQWGTVQKIERVYKFPADFIFLSAHSL